MRTTSEARCIKRNIRRLRLLTSSLALLLQIGLALPLSAALCEKMTVNNCAAVRDALAEVPWLKGNEAKLMAILSNSEQVDRFICTFLSTYGEGEEAEPPESKAFTTLPQEGEDRFLDLPFSSNITSEYAFRALHGDDHLQLVALDNDGRHETLIVIERTGNSFAMYLFPSQGDTPGLYCPEGTSDTLVLADEIIEWPDGWAHADPLPTFTHIYEWNGKDWVQADTKHKDFYAKEVLPKLLAKQAEGGCPDQEPEFQAKCRYALEKEISAVKAILAAP